MNTSAELVEALRRLRLLGATQLSHLAKRYAGQNPDPRVVAKWLVSQGWLTHFQANQLFKGKGNELLLGSYVLLEPVGEGGMGTVYKARNWKLNNIVALKRIRPERLKNPAAIRRFQREIRASAQLHHPNIVRALDADEVEGTYLLVTEYVDQAQDLNRIVREHGPLPIADACRHIQQAALGLQHAFERGMVHRDIKPHNVLVSGRAAGKKQETGVKAQGAGVRGQAGGKGQEAGVKNQGARPAAGEEWDTTVAPESGVLASSAKILDFGLARLDEGEDSSTLTQEGSVMGTMDYIAPEQARDPHGADIRADLYSLGCTLYFVLTGQAPFSGGTAAEKMYKHQFEEPTPLELVRRDAPQALGDIVRKAMAKRPEHRYQTPADLARDLGALLAGKPVTAEIPAMPAATATSTAPQPTPITEVPQAQSDTENPFAVLETAVDGPVSLARSKDLLTPKKMDPRVLLGIAGGALALIILLVVALVLGLRKPPPAPPEIVQASPVTGKTPKTTPSLQDQIEAEEKAAKENEQKEKEDKERQAKANAEKNKEKSDEAVWKKWLAQEAPLRSKRAAEADDAFKELEAKHQEKETTFVSFAKNLAAFQAKHGGTPAALRAAGLLNKLHSPLDDLDPAKLSADAKSGWRTADFPNGPPKELVAVRGEQRGRQWGPISQVLFAGTQQKMVVSAASGALEIMDADSREVLCVVPQADVWALAPDGKHVATGSFDGIVQVYDVDASKRLWSAEAFVGGGVRTMAFSPDSKTLAAGGGVNRAGNSNAGYLVRFWDAVSGGKRGVSPSLENQAAALAFTRDGAALLATTTGGWLHLINPQRPQDSTPLHGQGGVPIMYLAPDSKTVAGQWLAPAPPGKVLLKFFDVASRKPTITLEDLNGDAAARGIFSDDGKLFAYRETTGWVRLFALPKGNQLRAWEAHKEGGIADMLFTKDGKELWTASGFNSGDVAIWDPKNGKQIKTMPGYDEPTRAILELRLTADENVVAWHCYNKEIRFWRRDKQALQSIITRADAGPFSVSADGKRVVTGDHNMVRVWDAGTGLEQNLLRGKAPVFPNLAFSGDARFVLAAAADSRGSIVRWQLAPNPETDVFQWQGSGGTATEAPRVVPLPDFRRFVSFGTGIPLLRWNLATETVTNIAANAYGACVAPSGTRALTSQADGHISIWNLDSTKEIGTLASKGDPAKGDAHRIIDVAVTPDERHALVLQGTNSPRMLRLFDMKSGKEVYRFQHDHPCGRLALSPDGQHFLTTDYDGALSLWDVHTGTWIRKIDMGPGLPELAAVFSPDGKLAAAVTGTGVSLLEMPSANRVQDFPCPGPIQGIAFAPDGRHIAIGNGNGTIYLLRLGGAAKSKEAASAR